MLFQLEGINQFYGSFQALTDISVSARAGALGLLGPNGAGKTTLIKVLLGLLDPSTGTGSVLSNDIRTKATTIRQRVGYMPENECFFGAMSGFESVVFAGRLAGLPRRQAIRRAHEVLDYAGMDEARYRPTEGYSTGMKQRVKLAQALVHGPELVLLDEPTNGLDPEGRDDMLEIIDELSRIPVSVILSSHLLRDVERVCDHVLVLVGGRVRHYGPLEELVAGVAGEYQVQLKYPAHTTPLMDSLRAARIGARVLGGEGDTLVVSLGEADLSRFWQISVDMEVQVRHFAPVQRTLEHAFLDFLNEGARELEATP